MSIRAYRLLRNNKEQGPFTVQELIQQNLKPYDLIWVDGRSAAWNYPAEMQEFKTYVSLPGEQSVNLQGNKQTASAISPSVQAALTVNNNIAQPAIKQKPRYKVSAAWSKIQTITTPVDSDVIVAEPKKNSSQKNPVIKQPAGLSSRSLSWEEAWLDWEKEKTITPATEPVKVKPASTPQIKTINENHNVPVPEIKYAEPLESLKDKYIENILYRKQQAKKSFSFGKAAEFVIPCVALVVIFSVGYWLLHGSNETAAALSGAASVKTEQPAKIENTNIVPVNTDDNAAANTALQNSSNATQNIAAANEPVITDKAEDRKTNYTHPAKSTTLKQPDNSKKPNKFPATQIVLPGSKSTSEKIIDKPVKQLDASVINSVPSDKVNNDPSLLNTGDLNAGDTRPVRRRTNSDESAGNQASQKNETIVTKSIPAKSSANYVSVPEYIEINNGTANLKIENISDVDLDLVVVDVQYYDASSRFRKGETLYLHNLKAGKNIIVKTPKDINSQYATSKVSLISSDVNKVYVIGDN